VGKKKAIKVSPYNKDNELMANCGLIKELNMNRPNILFLCADMIGAKNFGCYGDPAKVTPNVDSWSKEGVIFDKAYCACPPCIPARVSMMCGQYASTHGKIAHMKMKLEPRPKLIPEILASHGYSTALVGKTHWWPPADSLGCEETHITIDNHLTPELGNKDAYIRFLRERKVFDYNPETWEQNRHLINPDNLPEDCLKVNWTGDTACSLLEKLSDKDKPFFLFCSFVEPHGRGSVQEKYLETLKDINLPAITGREGEHDNKPEIQKRIAEENKAKFIRRDLDKYRRGVYASLSLVDMNIGRILGKVDTLGIKDNTIIIFVTDHGDFLFDHWLTGKSFLYDSAIRIPFIISGPGIPAGEHRSHLVSHIDLLPTILDFCDVSREGLAIDGESVVPVFKDIDADWREALFCEVEQTTDVFKNVSSSIVKMIRKGPWKYVYTVVEGRIVEDELYNLENDPEELYNLADKPEYQMRITEFRSEILRWLVTRQINRLKSEPENHYPVPRIEKRIF